MRSIPVANLLETESTPMVPPLGSLLGSSEESEDSFDDSSDHVRGDFVLDVAREVLVRSADDADVDETSLAIVGSRLVMSGQRSHVDVAEQVLRELAAELTRKITVRASLYSVPAEDRFESVIPSGRLAQIEPRLNLVWRSDAATRSGFSTGLSQERLTRYVHDSGVEVAQDQAIADPEVGAMFEGVRLFVEPHAIVASDDLVLHCQVAFAQLHEPIEVRSSGVDEMTALDVPLLQNNQAGFSGRISNGGALLLHIGGAESAGASYLLVVEARREDPVAGAAHDGLAVMPCSALTTGAPSGVVSSKLRNPGRSEDSDSILPLRVNAFESEASSVFSVDTLIEMLGHVVRDALDEGRVRIEAHAGHVFVMGPAQEQRAVQDALVMIHDQWLHGAACEFETVLERATDGYGGVFASVAQGEEANVLHRISVPMLLGRPHFVLRGLESSTTQDFEVEIAQDASASDPVVVSTFSGVFAATVLHDCLDGVGARVDIDVADVEARARRSIETKHGGDLYMPRTSRSRLSHRGSIVSGRTVTLGTAGVVTVGRDRFRLSQRLRVTAL